MKATNDKRKQRVTLRTILNGRIFESKWLRRNRLLLLLITGLLLINISYRYKSEKVIREISSTQDSLKELRSESIAIAAELMQLSRPSQVIERVEKNNIGLEVSKEPPFKLYVDKE